MGKNWHFIRKADFSQIAFSKAARFLFLEKEENNKTRKERLNGTFQKAEEVALDEAHVLQGFSVFQENL